MKKPITRQIVIVKAKLFELAIVFPIPCPIGSSPWSIPNRNNVSPTITMTDPIKNAYNRVESIGQIVKFSTTTIPVIGSTEKSTSFNFSFKPPK